MPHIVSVELSDETAARLGDLTTTTGAPAAELVRAALEAKYGRRPAPRHGPHRETVSRARRRASPDPSSPFVDYGGEG